MSPGTDVMARFLGSENVDRGRDYLEQLDPELHRYIMDFVYGEVYAGDASRPQDAGAVHGGDARHARTSSCNSASTFVPPAGREPRRRRSARSCARSPSTPASRAPGMPWRR